MSGLVGSEYVLLDDSSVGGRSLSHYFQTAVGVVGALLTTLAGFAATHELWLATGEDSASNSPTPFLPTQGVESVLVQPGPLSGLQLVPPLLTPACLFSYGHLLKQDEKNKPFSAGCKVWDGWVYGALLSEPFAEATGQADDVLKGRMFCWSSSVIQEKLRLADQQRGYLPGSDKDSLRRGSVSVVLKDGSTQRAYWYYQSAKKPKPKPSFLTLTRGNVTKRLPTEAPVVSCEPERSPKSTSSRGTRGSLPILDLEAELRAAATQANKSHLVRIVIEAPTGSGKSTQVPQILLDRGCAKDADGWDGEIIVLQPRRLAAKMLARRVSWERNVQLGQQVGYTIRFEDVTGRDTRIRYVTEGVLLRRLLTDPQLKGVSTVIFDEFHERHFFSDVSLARCLETQDTVRPDLKIVVMSATLQVEALNSYLGPQCKHLISQGRTFPVDIKFVPSNAKLDVWNHVTYALADHFKTHETQGHTLVFLPGTFEIRKTMEMIQLQPWAKCFEVHALYGELSPGKVDAAVGPSNKPKIICATNIAETSLTIDGVRLVVDSGLERRSDFDVRRGITTLTVEKISRASAEQRCGRAGRTGPGLCLRLWSETEHAVRDAATPAEIHRTDLAEAFLLLKASGIEDVRAFRWYEAPEEAAFERAIGWLQTLGALDEETLTPLGWKLSRLPLAPRFGRILFEAVEQRVNVEFFAFVAATSQARQLFQKNPRAGSLKLLDFVERSDTSDFQPLFRAWSRARDINFDATGCNKFGINPMAAREISLTTQQFMKIVGSNFIQDDEMPASDTIGRILLTSFSDRLALRHSDQTLACAVIGKRRGELDKSSVLASAKGTHELLFVAGDMLEIEGRKDVTVRLSLATQIKEKWLRELFPHDFSERSVASWVATSQFVAAMKETRFRDLLLESVRSGEPTKDAAAGILAGEVAAGRLELKQWGSGTAAEQWIGRVNTVANAFPEYQIEPIDEEGRLLMLTDICAGAVRYKDIKDRPVMNVVKSWLTPAMVPLLDQFAPESMKLSNGRSARIKYFAAPGAKPKISVLIQHLFGVKETPTIAGGRVPLLVEILAPNSRPCQTTEDLAGFWAGSYAGVRADLRGRYPKHAWPDPDTISA
eukprot:gb/GEZN01000940.1/.p1 GENE.gb/GEZN01000940.1/~~gb/GEZN01000940.1/.p1  ORF type:complete len:1112 (+),score=139.55 gb/GEZN01000940.1/:92-3427(+)